jgi:hypothetical protein
MERLNASENTGEEIVIELYQNEELMDDIPMIETSIENLSLETNASWASKNYDERFILNLQKLHAQRLFWKPKGRNVICWAFYVVNDNKPMDGKIPQVMRCQLCYKTPMLYNPRTKLKKGLISYYKTNGISTLKKHVDVKHHLLANKLDEEMNN